MIESAQASDAIVPRCWVCGRTEDELKAVNPPGSFIDGLVDHQLLSLPVPYKLCNICRWIIINVINSDELGLVRLISDHTNAINGIEQRFDQLEAQVIREIVERR